MTTSTPAADKVSKASFLVSTPSVYGWQQIAETLLSQLGGGIQIDAELAAVSLIGEGLNRDNQTLLTTLALLHRHQIAVHGITTTSFRISLLISRKHLEGGIRLCHAHWIAGTAPEPPMG